jgi:hypothetical protein
MSNKVSLQSSSELWDGITFWLAVVGTALLFISAFTGIVARRSARRWAEERGQQAQREKRTHEQDLAKSNEKIAELERETADAKARALEAKVELEKFKAPRVISPEQRDALISELKPFGKQRVDVFALINHGEVVGLRDDIQAALRGADWDARVNLNHHVAVFGGVGGVAVEIPAGASDDLRKIASALATALRKAGLQTSGPWSSYSMVSDAPMEVLVGNKP